MTRISTFMAFSALLALALPAVAQTTDPAAAPATPPVVAPATDAPATDAPATGAPPADAAADGFSTGQPVDGIGSTYTRESFEDWSLNCVRVEAGKQEPCQIYQLLKDDKGTPVAEINIVGLAPGGDALAGATIVTPLETLLTEALTLQVDTAQAKRYPFTFCAAIGCIARVGFTEADLAAFKKGNKATISVVPVAAPAQKVTVAVSLKGFTAAFDAVNAANKPAAP